MDKPKQIIGVNRQTGELVSVREDGTLEGAAEGKPVSTRMIHAGQISAAHFDDAMTTISAEPRIFIDKAAKILKDSWYELRRSRTEADKMWVLGQIEAYHDLGVLNEVEYKGWILQIEGCPGHADEGDWASCTYCGDRPSPA